MSLTKLRSELDREERRVREKSVQEEGKREIERRAQDRDRDREVSRLRVQREREELARS